MGFQSSLMPQAQLAAGRPATPIVPRSRVEPIPEPKTQFVRRDFLWLATVSSALDPKVRARKIVSDIAKDHGLSVDEVMGDHRVARIVKARHDAICAVANALPKWSASELGRFFNRDHTSILHVLRIRGVRLSLSPERARQLRAMWRHGADTARIAQTLCLPEPAVAQFIARERDREAANDAVRLAMRA